MAVIFAEEVDRRVAEAIDNLTEKITDEVRTIILMEMEFSPPVQCNCSHAMPTAPAVGAGAGVDVGVSADMDAISDDSITSAIQIPTRAPMRFHMN
jgi:hypothetical protein